LNLLIKNIKGLAGVYHNNPWKKGGEDLKELPIIDDAFLEIGDGKITSFGPMKNLSPDTDWDQEIDAEGRFVFPTYVDSHTHLVYSSSRNAEFRDRILGLSYEQIAVNGGGILNSAKKLQETSEEDLFEGAWKRLMSIISMGTGAVEIKSGYGLSVDDEIKMLRVIKKLKEKSPIPVKATFLGAHAFPRENSREEYMGLILNEMLPRIGEEGLADYCDVFCDRGFFSEKETEEILEEGWKHGLKPKIHANELDFSGGIQVGVQQRAISVDHLECVGPEEIEALKNSETIPTLLPSTAFFLGLKYPPARKMIDADLPVSLASDFNPGSSPSGNMNFVISLACIQMKMLPEEAINAATLNASFALELQDQLGSFFVGADANFILTKKISSISEIPYSFGSNQIDSVYINGTKI
jgi:imidazolonepropionase